MTSVGSVVQFLDKEECRPISSLLYERRVAGGATLFDYDEPADTFYILKEGRLSVQKYTGFQDKLQVIALFDPGAVVSEGALFLNNIHSTRVTAIEDCLLLCLAGKDFQRIKAESGTVACSFMEYVFSVISLRLEKTSERLAHIL